MAIFDPVIFDPVIFDTGETITTVGIRPDVGQAVTSKPTSGSAEREF